MQSCDLQDDLLIIGFQDTLRDTEQYQIENNNNNCLM